jgi:hypothetical protein
MPEWDGPNISTREVGTKVMKKAIGIDPDSKGYVCCLVDGTVVQARGVALM